MYWSGAELNVRLNVVGMAKGKAGSHDCARTRCEGLKGGVQGGRFKWQQQVAWRA